MSDTSNSKEIGGITEIGRSVGECSFEWTIPDFLSLSSEDGEYYDSPVFNACDGKWKLQIFPGGYVEDLKDWVSLFFYRMEEGPPKSLNITIGTRCPEGIKNKSERMEEFWENEDVCNWYGFCRRSEFMPGNELIITIDIKNVVPSFKSDSSSQTVEAEEQQSLDKQGMEELKESMQRLFTSGEDSDVLLKVQSKKFKAHRAILRVRSPVFQAMFTHDMVEKQSGVVTMEDHDTESFPAFLEYVYTGNTGMISIKNVFSLYTASDKYDMVTLKKACAEFLKNNLTVPCFCDAITLAVKYNEMELIEFVTEFFCINSLDICETVEWQIFLKENTTIGNELIIKAFSKYKNV